MTVKLSSILPDPRRNGLTAIEDALTGDEDQRMHVVIALVSRHHYQVDDATGDVTPTVAIRAIEVVRDDLPTLTRILARANEQRLGSPVLPFDTEEEIRAVFEGVNLETGEILGEPGEGDAG